MTMPVEVAGLVQWVEMEPIQEAQERAAMAALAPLGQMVQHTQAGVVVEHEVNLAQVDQEVVGLEAPPMALLVLQILAVGVGVRVQETLTLVAMAVQALSLFGTLGQHKKLRVEPSQLLVATPTTRSRVLELSR